MSTLPGAPPVGLPGRVRELINQGFRPDEILAAIVCEFHPFQDVEHFARAEMDRHERSDFRRGLELSIESLLRENGADWNIPLLVADRSDRGTFIERLKLAYRIFPALALEYILARRREIDDQLVSNPAFPLPTVLRAERRHLTDLVNQFAELAVVPQTGLEIIRALVRDHVRRTGSPRVVAQTATCFERAFFKLSAVLNERGAGELVEHSLAGLLPEVTPEDSS